MSTRYSRRIAHITLLLSLLFARTLSADVTEIGGGQQIVGIGDTNTTYYTPSAAFFGSYVFLFVQGDADLMDQSLYDQILMFQKPNSWESLVTPYTNPTLILGDSQFHYGGPSVFADVGRLFMTVSKSPGTDANNFVETLLGRSFDGSNWSWSTLFLDPTGFDIPALSLKYASINGQNYWWGVAWVKFPGGGGGLTAMRVHLAQHGADAVPDYIEVISGGAWRQFGVGSAIPFTPDVLAYGSSPKLKEIDGHWEVWYSTDWSYWPTCGCVIGGTGPHYGAGIGYRTLTTDYDFGPEQYVWSSIRCMPASYSYSRITPDRIEGTPLLYSGSNDPLPWREQCFDNFVGEYIVVTSLQ